MKKILAILFLFCFFQSQAQFYFGNYYSFSFINLSSPVKWYEENTRLKNAGIKEVIEYAKDNKTGEYYQVNHYELNETARIIHYKQFKKKGAKLKMQIHCDFQHDLLNEMRAQKANGDTIYLTRYEYQNKKEIGRSYYKKNQLNSPEWRTENQFNDSGKLIMSQSFSKGKLNYRYEYDFYPNGSKKETRYYNGKKKLKYRYTYECDPKGELENKEVKNRNYCIKKEEKNDGSYMEISEYKNEKGKITKFIRHYSADSLLTLSEYYNFKGELYFKTAYQYNTDKQITSVENSNKKGIMNVSIFDYDEKGLFTKGTRLNKKGKTTYQWRFEYKK
ncbi:MAG: hypothetical protein ACOVP1_14275 [Bacteroidia bacterium]